MYYYRCYSNGCILRISTRELFTFLNEFLFRFLGATKFVYVLFNHGMLIDFVKNLLGQPTATYSNFSAS